MEWPVAFITAWRIAFVLTLLVGPLGFKLATNVLMLVYGRRSAA